MPIATDEEFFGASPSASPSPTGGVLSDEEFFAPSADESPTPSLTPETDKAVKDSESLYRERHHMPSGFPEHVTSFLQGAGLPTSLEGLKTAGKFLIRSPVQDVRDIYQAISELPGRLSDFKQTLKGSPAATVYEDPFSKEAFGVYGTAVGMLIPAAEKGIALARGVPEAPAAVPETQPLQTIEAKLPIGGEEDAVNVPETTQLHGNVQQPEVPIESTGQMPADVSGEGIPASGQGEILGGETPPTSEQIAEPIVLPESPATEQPTETPAPIPETAAPAPTTYFKGDKAEYTGNVQQLHGGTFYEVKMLEGTDAGKLKVVTNPPVEDAGARPVVDLREGDFPPEQFAKITQEDYVNSQNPAGLVDVKVYQSLYRQDVKNAMRRYELSPEEAKAKIGDLPSLDVWIRDLAQAEREFPGQEKFSIERKVREGEYVSPYYLEKYGLKDTGSKPASPRLLPGETQGDLISSTQQEPFQLVGGETPDFEAQMTKEQKAELARMKAEEEQSQFADFQDYQQRGGQELIDAISSLGGIRETAPDFGTIREAFLGKSKHGTQASARSVVGDIRYGDIFKANAPHEDALVGALRERGFDIETPGQLADILDTRLKTGKEVWGMEARAQEGDVSGFQGFAIGAAGAKEIPEPTAVYLRNAKVDHARMARGELPLMSPARKAMGKTWEEGMRRIDVDPAIGDRMVSDILRGKKKEISETDHAVLLHERIRVANERAMEADRSSDPNASEEDRAEAHLRWAALEDRTNDIDHAIQEAGTVSGRALQFRHAVARDDFTFEGMERQARAAKGGPLTEVESADIKAKSEEIAGVEKEAEQRETKVGQDRAETAFQQSLGNLRKEAKSRPPVDLDEQADKIVNALNKHAAEGESPKDLSSFIQSLALNFVRRGVTEREPLIDAVHSVLSRIFPDLTREGTRDAISGYGDFKPLDPEAAKVTLRDLKGQMQQLGKIEDMAKRSEAPKKTGIERRTPSDTERRLIKEVNELKKKGGYNVTDPAKALQSAQDAIKTRLRNLIRDREHAIATGEKIPGRKGVPTDQEIESLRAKAAELQKRYQEKFPVSEAERRRIALDAYKTRVQTRIADIEDKLARKDFSSNVRPKLELDTEAFNLRAKAEQLKTDWLRGQAQERLKGRSGWEKVQDTLVKWRRGFVLSSPTTLAKLTSAAIERMTITPMEEVAGGILGKIPGLKQVSEMAPREGGFNAKAEAKAFTEGFTKGMADAWQMLRTGKSSLETIYGKRDVMPRSAIDFIGTLHGALKTVTKRNEFARSLEKRATQAIANGVDVSDPMVQTRLALDAYKDANRSIFLQDNRMVSAYQRAVSSLEQSKAGEKVPASSKALATTARVLLPIVKVPTNIVAETMQYATGSITGSVRFANAMRKGLDTLSPAQADLIMRDLKKGSVGLAGLIIGYLNADKIGGYYQPGQKRESGDVGFGKVRMFGVDLPSYLIHNPLLETLQIGATIRRVADSKLRKRDEATQGIGEGLMAGALGITSEVPFVREMLGELPKVLQSPQERKQFIGEFAKSLIVPQAAQWLAYHMDKRQGTPVKRETDTTIQHIESGIPGIRQTLPEKSGPRHYSTRAGKTTVTAGP